MACGDIPVRSFMEDTGIKWRHGKPNYDLVDSKYLREKTKNHKADSLEKIVENLVKTWEMESSHKTSAKDWGSIEDCFTISSNGGKKFNLDDNIREGNYNMLLDGVPLYDNTQETNESSHKLFREAFAGGFAWELLELHSGPPVVSFTWRHWGTWEGKFRENEPTGETIEMFGSCVVRVSESLKVESIEVYYDPNPMMAKLMNFDLRKCELK